MFDYAADVRRAYEGEIGGELVYRTLAIQCGDADRRQKMNAIADLEAKTSARLRPIADRLGIVCRMGDVFVKAEARARQLDLLSWPALMLKATVDWPPYVVRFEDLASRAPAGDRHAIDFLLSHEKALVHFANLEHAKQSAEESMRLIRALLSGSV
jgi:hypothetical protein